VVNNFLVGLGRKIYLSAENDNSSITNESTKIKIWEGYFYYNKPSNVYMQKCFSMDETKEKYASTCYKYDKDTLAH